MSQNSLRNRTKKSLGSHTFFCLSQLKHCGLNDISRLPYSIKVILESALRNCDGFQITEGDVQTLAGWTPETAGNVEIAFKPARVVLQDFTGVPAVVDLAAMRSAMHRMGGDTTKINPLVPCDLVIDHSVQVDAFGSSDALQKNVDIEFTRNQERYEFLKWGQKAFKNFRVVPPAMGIVHQVNLEYLATGIIAKAIEGETHIYPDSLVGTDSHTTMINGIGVLGWGVGGIEAEAVMLGEPIYMLMPEVIGFRLKGTLRKDVTATDIVLTATKRLRERGVVGKIVEYFGDGLKSLSIPDRATLANMAPEYGATMGFCPIDTKTLDFYRSTNRDSDLVSLVEAYSKEQGMFVEEGMPDPIYSDVVELDLSRVEPSLAGPKRPQDMVLLRDMKTAFDQSLKTPVAERGFALTDQEMSKSSPVQDGTEEMLSHGSVVIAAITSCTNTSNPSVMVAAGLLAKKAVEKGLKTKAYCKTSLAPGSRVVTEYLTASGLLPYLEQLRFNLVGYGCTTCIGNSGPLPGPVGDAIQDQDLVAASVLSGNRNFEGRVNPLVKANYLASPPLVVAYALAGHLNVDLVQDPLGQDTDGQPVFLRDIWPSREEIQEVVEASVTREAFQSQYQDTFKGSEDWQKIIASEEDLYPWNEESTYIQEPPFFTEMTREVHPIEPIQDARVLLMLGDSITTDHISPAGAIGETTPAGTYLLDAGISKDAFNSYGSRRGNDRVMTRGTFANIRLRNLLVPGSEGTCTIHHPSGDQMSVYDAALKYRQDETPLVVLAGKEYGTGSSRDWAAKGTTLLGVRVVIAESYERIHRSNLVGMGVLPLQFVRGESREFLKLEGNETFEFAGLNDRLKPRQKIEVKAVTPNGKSIVFKTKVRIDTPVEVDYYRNGGILQTVIRKLLKD